MFPGQSSMWQMTAAQRLLLLGPPKVTKEGKPIAPVKKPDVKRFTREEMKELTAKRLAKIPVGPQPKEKTEHATPGADG